MIIHRFWYREVRDRVYGKYGVRCEGWFLFGIVPLYVRQMTFTG